MDLRLFIISCVGLLKLLPLPIESCTYKDECRCLFVNQSLYADCSNLSLNDSPTFWPNVTRINLSRNQLTHFPNRSRLPDNLTYLDFSHNKICDFGQDTFKHLWKLSDLRLNGNKLRVSPELKSTYFADLISIKHLDLSHNPELTFRILPILTPGIQNSTIQILRLDKIHCTFGMRTELRIEDIRMLNYTKLKELHLSSNKIEIIENGAIALLPSTLEKISIADNSFSFGIYLLEMNKLKGLKWLNASLQHMQHNPVEVFRDLILFSCIDMWRQQSFNQSFYEVKSKFGCVPKAATNHIFQEYSPIDLNYTFLFPENLKTFYMNESGIGYAIPKIGFTKNSLENLYLQGNVLMSWLGPVHGVENLRRFNLSNNFCSKISDNFFQHFTNLSELFLNNNLIGFSLAKDTDGNIFKDLKELKHLELKNNKISQLSYSVFRNLKNLERLYMNDNFLNDIKFNIANLKSLVFFDISGNQIQQLSEASMKQLDEHANKANITLNLSRNPLLCNCQTLPFMQWMVKKLSTNIRIENFRHYTCTETSTEGKVLKFTNIEQHIEGLIKECRSYSTLIFIIASLILLFLVALSAGLVYRYRWKLRYFYYMTKSRYHGYKSVRGDYQSDFKYDAFVSYAEEDMEFVREMISELEGDRSLRLCIHHRDFVPGYDIAENIITAINKSKKTIIILSPNFINSSWCMYELHIAKMEEIYSRNDEDVLFLICYESIPADRIPLSIMDVINQKSYIEFPNDEYGNTVFWNRLLETLK